MSAINAEQFDAICDHYATSIDGFQTSAVKCGHKGSTAYDMIKRDDCSGKYAQAHDLKMFWMFEEMHRLINLVPPTDDNGKTDNGWVTWRKNQVDLLKWTLSKLWPKRFGERIEHETTVRVAPSENIDAVIERMGGAKAAREILGGAIGNNC